MPRRFLLSALLFLLAPLLRADDAIGFIEKFALAPDREAVLTQLIPGSEEFYFYHALQYQNTRQKEKLTAILQQWEKRFPNSEKKRIIENREALLSYEADPQATLKFLRERLALEFNHQQEARDQKPDLPAALDPKLIGRDVFLRENMGSDNDLRQLRLSALEALVRDKVPLNPAQVRAVLARLERPDLPNLLDLIEADLKVPASRGFGEFPIHRALLPEQLDELARRRPALYTEQAFVFARLRKLAPGADADAEFDPAERAAWLERAWAWASKLPAAFNSLKASLLRQRLEYDLTRGVYDEQRFLAYLKLPRRAGYVSPKFVDAPAQQGGMVDLNADFKEAIPFARPVGNDEELVRTYFSQLFAKLDPNGALDPESVLAPWLPYVRDTWLRPVFAEAMIVNGFGDPERWASLLSPTAFQRLKERVDIDFARTNPQFFSPADEVSLKLTLKNAPRLIVKIYEIDTLSYFLANKTQLNTDLALDGLVPNRELTKDFSAEPAGQSPFLRTARTFAFPELKGKRGAWVIEFIGGGKSSRALVRKGQWSLVQSAGPAGDLLTVLDESGQPVKDAVVWLDGRKFTPDERLGAIQVPYTQQPGTKPVILADPEGTFATLAEFEHHAEAYRFDAQFHLEREQLLAGRKATLAIHPQLLLGREEVSLGLLSETRLTLVSKSLDGISTTSEVKAPTLEHEHDFTHTFTVPDRLAELTVTLSGKVENLSKSGQKEDLSASRSWTLNGIDKTNETNGGHLSKLGDSYIFELLGKNGEPLADRQVLFEFVHRDFSHALGRALRTDEKGRIDLGALPGLEEITADLSDGFVSATTTPRRSSWALSIFDQTWPEMLHARAGEIVRVPVASPQVEFSLLEQRAGTFAVDRHASGHMEGGYLVLEGLPAGDYSLRVRGGEDQETTLRITAGRSVAGWLVSPHRSLEVREPAPLQIAGAQVDAGGLTVQLAQWDRFTRVHIAATRFVPEQTLFELGERERIDPAWSTPDKLPALYAPGRNIGDEYRYILERRYSRSFPGNMLARPGLLLNPWETRSTELLAQLADAGKSAAAMNGARRGAINQPQPATPNALEAKSTVDLEAPEGTNLDFLAASAPVAWNLVPDDHGVVRLDRKALGDRQHVQILAENLTGAVWRAFALPEANTKFRDLRLAESLDSATVFTRKKEATVLLAGQTLKLPGVLTSELETYDSLRGVAALYTTLSGDARLAKFAWLLDWPSLKEEEKRAKYSEFACHELNFFLARKDPEFFRRVIVPYLANKKEKTFLDEYLLEAPLQRWLEPWAYEQLNVAERCLLARRIPGEVAATARHISELRELLPPNPEKEEWLFEGALRGRSLDEEVRLGEDKSPAPNPEKLLQAQQALNMDLPAAAAAPASDRPADALKSAAVNGQLGLARKADEGLAMVEEKSKQLEQAEVAGQKDATAFGHAGGTLNRALLQKGMAERQRSVARAFYRALGPAKEWAEDNYYQVPLAQRGPELIAINDFWRDYALWDGKAPFISSHFAEATHSFSEMMLALAVLDLPFASPKHETNADAGAFTLKAAGPLIAFHQEIEPAAPPKENSELLVSQNFFRADDRYRQEGNERFDKYVSGEFLTGVTYGANIVVTNPTSSPQKLQLLLQIPQGALPVLGSRATDSKRLRLGAYTTQTFEYFFYFPAPSVAGHPFAHYPVHVSREEASAGAAKPVTFLVVRQLSQVDNTSWGYVSQYGTDAEALAWLKTHNLQRTDLDKIAWRARKSADFFHQALSLLAAAHCYSSTLWSYAVYHNDPAALREFLRHQDDFLAHCGPALKARLLEIDPIERRQYEQLEYSPLVNQRVHRFTAEHRIPNPVLLRQYQSLLEILAHRPALEPMDEMSVVYYLFLQDRVEEALARFHALKPESLPTRLQYDYFRCYAAFYEEQLPEARAIVKQYADYPVDRWRKLFAEAGAELDEIAGAAVAHPSPGPVPDRDAQQAELAATEPSFDFKVENRRIALTWKNLTDVTVNYYLMEPEFLFSSSPFVTEDPARFSIIKPTRSDTQKLPAGQESLDVPLPPEFARANVLVEILGAGQRHAQAYHANSLRLTLAENYGRLEVREQTAGQPVPKAYVKVYARLRNGTIRFYRDGYTDLRGKFDYASQNSSEGMAVPLAREPGEKGGTLGYQPIRPDELGEVEKFAILILSDAHGDLVKEAAPPAP